LPQKEEENMIQTRKPYSPKVKFQAVMQLLKGRQNCNRGSPDLGSASHYGKELERRIYEQGP